MANATEDQVRKAIERLPAQDVQTIGNLRVNAVRMGAVAEPLVAAIDARLADFNESGGMAKHRLDFARSMLGLMRRRPTGQWVSSRDLFVSAKVAFAENPYVAYMAEKGARQIPVTKALKDVLPEFPDLEHRKVGEEQSGRVYYCRR